MIGSSKILILQWRIASENSFQKYPYSPLGLNQNLLLLWNHGFRVCNLCFFFVLCFSFFLFFSFLSFLLLCNFKPFSIKFLQGCAPPVHFKKRRKRNTYLDKFSVGRVLDSTLRDFSIMPKSQFYVCPLMHQTQYPIGRSKPAA